MTATQLTQQQCAARDLLNEHILSPDILERCVLDYSLHCLAPEATLGTLEKLPIELHHQILGHIDVESLLRFRRVNQKAMAYSG
jgi:hypothetical protein